MTSSERFKQELQAGNIAKALEIGFSNALELEIVTWIAKAEPSEQTEIPSPAERLRTRVSLLDGRIENEVGSLFLNSSAYAELREFHLSQVKEGQELIQSKLKSLQILLQTWMMTQPAESIQALGQSAGANQADSTMDLAASPEPTNVTHLAQHPQNTSSANATEEESTTQESTAAIASQLLAALSSTASLKSDLPIPICTDELPLHLDSGEPFEVEVASASEYEAMDSSASTDEPSTIETEIPPSIEDILKNLFSSSSIDAVDDQTSTRLDEEHLAPLNTAEDRETFTSESSIFLTTEQVDLSLDLSIEELLADLFYEDELPLSFSASAMQWQEHSESASNEIQPTTDALFEELNSFADNAVPSGLKVEKPS
jgi:hypothetical protein